MIYPPMAQLLNKVDSRYTVVIMIAKRARMLTNGAQKLTDVDSQKDVTLAINEIAENKIVYRRIKKQQPTHENMVETSIDSAEEQS